LLRSLLRFLTTMLRRFFSFLDTPAIQAALAKKSAEAAQAVPPTEPTAPPTTVTSEASMQDSKLNTISVPVAGTQAPATITRATDVPFRVVVRNVGGNLVFLAHDSSTLTTAPVSANSYQLPPGESETFVLNAKQGIFAAAQGGGGQISVAISEAIPTKWMES
jgi:hypothetical protein